MPSLYLLLPKVKCFQKNKNKNKVEVCNMYCK